MSRQQGLKKCFTTENILTLIEEVKKRQCLWNPECENYNDRAALSTAWAEICRILNMQERRVRLKWKTIRDVFKRELRKNNVSDGFEEYKGKWKYFKLLWFLHRPDELSNDDYEVLVISPDDSPKRIKFEPNETTEFEDFASNVDPLPEDKSIPQSKSDDDDYDLMFLKSLTPFMRELEPMRKLVVRNKIQDMILSEIAAQMSSRKF
ncbi:uncharacterized protein LOC119832677 [Zerene cesonia]|uniref:uncharacterized protein LOC119832677 n=1 Tax=Zerene cesonia TaxID=33412 RepID=UPI0018E4F715|nr:uncharacterized protein LOC119832677 [Zerene cesonia]